jgi:hypothetical protein
MFKFSLVIIGIVSTLMQAWNRFGFEVCHNCEGALLLHTWPCNAYYVESFF